MKAPSEQAQELALAIARHSPLIADNLGLQMSAEDLKYVNDFVVTFHKAAAMSPHLTVGDWLDWAGYDPL